MSGSLNLHTIMDHNDDIEAGAQAQGAAQDKATQVNLDDHHDTDHDDDHDHGGPPPSEDNMLTGRLLDIVAKVIIIIIIIIIIVILILYLMSCVSDESNTGGNVECGRLTDTCPRPGCGTGASVPAGAATSGVNTEASSQ